MKKEIENLNKAVMEQENRMRKLGLAPAPFLMSDVKATVALEIIMELTDFTMEEVELRFKRSLLGTLTEVADSAEKAKSKKIQTPHLIVPGGDGGNGACGK